MPARIWKTRSMNATRKTDFQATMATAKQKLNQRGTDIIDRDKVNCDFSTVFLYKVRFSPTQHLTLLRVTVLALLLFLQPTTLAENDLSISTDTVASDKIAFVKFIKFDPAEYQNEREGEIKAIIDKLKLLPEDSTISLIGHSQSRTNKATENLALDRALVVQKKLVGLGIAKERFELNAEIANHKNEGDLLHGVLLLATPPSTSHQSTSIATKKTSDVKVEGNNEKIEPSINADSGDQTVANKTNGDQSIAEKTTGEQVQGDKKKTEPTINADSGDQTVANKTDKTIDNQPIAEKTDATNQQDKQLTIISESSSQKSQQTAQVETAPPSPNSTTDKEPIKNTAKDNAEKIDLCAQLVMNIGSLKTNLEREIGDCGYVMGDWKFSSKTELIDWEIPISYSVNIDDGIFGILNIIENNYQIRAHIHQLDKSIDFLSSVRHRRDLNK